MKRSTTLSLALSAVLLSGCLTMRDSKGIVIAPEPGAASVTVAADAVAKCYNLLLVTWCSLDLRLRQVGGRSAQSPQAKRVRAYISANYGKIIGQLDSGSGPELAALLDLLQTPGPQRFEAILAMKGFNLRAPRNAAAFAALVVDNLLKFS